MATCKDCIHEKACTEMLKAQGYEVGADYKGNADRCDTFKNKADVVEVVRCDKCHYKRVGHSEFGSYYYCIHPESGLAQIKKETDYCSYGTPKERGGEK